MLCTRSKPNLSFKNVKQTRWPGFDISENGTAKWLLSNLTGTVDFRFYDTCHILSSVRIFNLAYGQVSDVPVNMAV